MRAMPNLDMMRAFAVILVIVEHTLLAYRVMWLGPFEVSWIGIAGVFLFFVHTSLVLMWSLERKPHTLDFYIRRVFRIYPLAIAAVLIAVLFHAPVAATAADYFQYSHASHSTVLANCLLVQNLTGQINVIGVMWTLPLETQMYILLPLLFFFVRKNASQALLLFLWLFAAVFAWHTFEYVNVAAAIPYFIPGVMAYVGFAKRRAKLPAWLFLPFLVLVVGGFLLRPSFQKGWLLCLVVGLLLPSFRQVRMPWLMRGSHEVAKYSYGMYLVHPFALVVSLYLLPHWPLAAQLAVEVLVIGAASVAAYHLLEKPMIRLGSKLAGAAEKRFEQIEMTSEI